MIEMEKMQQKYDLIGYACMHVLLKLTTVASECSVLSTDSVMSDSRDVNEINVSVSE